MGPRTNRVEPLSWRAYVRTRIVLVLVPKTRMGMTIRRPSSPTTVRNPFFSFRYIFFFYLDQFLDRIYIYNLYSARRVYVNLII